MPDRCLHIVLGATSSGKSTFLEKELSSKEAQQKFGNRMYLVSSTADMTKAFKFIPKARRFEGFDPNFITTILKHQKEQISKGKGKPVCIIFDDIIATLDMRKKEGKIFDLLATSGRHYLVTVYCTTQYIKKMTPTQRSNAYFYIFQSSIGQVETLYDIIPSKCNIRSKGNWIYKYQRALRDNPQYSCIFISPFLEDEVNIEVLTP